MKKYIIIAIVFLFIGGVFSFLIMKSSTEDQLQSDSDLIHQQMKNVSKIVVNEAKISQIYNYTDQKSLLNLISFDKKALVVVNADVQIMYDLSKLDFLVDESNKTLTILSIPKEEIKISPEIKIYNIEESSFNTFKGEDFNKVQEEVKGKFKSEILNSNIQRNAKQRLISELGKFLVVTESLGWRLIYQEREILTMDSFDGFVP